MSVSESARAARRAEVERALARYPHLTAEGLAELTDYFERDASALDVGLIASNPEIAERYQAFRATHVDPLRPRDWVRGALFAGMVAATLVAMLWPALQ
ncbi:MAG: hypothetical protein KGL54_10270 [Sphingomonadales bacterium]|nr:hypothetical protein [Sphingomonadales bacterium]